MPVCWWSSSGERPRGWAWPKVHKARGNIADVHDAGDVFMYRDSSVSPLLDLRRRFKSVMDVLDAMIRKGYRVSVRLNLLFSVIGYLEW